MNTTSKNKAGFETIFNLLTELDTLCRRSNLTSIETDLVKDKLRKLYEHFHSGPVGVPTPGNDRTVEWDAPVNPEMSPAAVEEIIQLSETDLHEIGSDELLSSRPAEKESSPRVENKTTQPDLFSEPRKKEEERAVPVQKTNPVENQPESVAEKIQKEVRVQQLKTAIGINEKFFFINELFDGNLNVYNAAIESLDKAENLVSARALINELSDRHGWKAHEEAREQLLQFVERKFK